MNSKKAPVKKQEEPAYEEDFDVDPFEDKKPSKQPAKPV